MLNPNAMSPPTENAHPAPLPCREAASFNKAVERTAAERLGFDAVGFMNTIGEGLSALTAAVAQLGRSTQT